MSESYRIYSQDPPPQIIQSIKKFTKVHLLFRFILIGQKSLTSFKFNFVVLFNLPLFYLFKNRFDTKIMSPEAASTSSVSLFQLIHIT